ncbi:polycomb group protein Psc-like [Coccinella septempunctata]|uniref:polycomb group protein Psc-like n=1 Tax=Coccinella septempunctata TaxID=41139 RepID=UPI001D09066E|nr:polycomb group protein Psc-like [Coccinella septempunctata]XP_044762697.1 polycomb group protein Psc-like [Coccinella septempunctata]XP_044762698.1 polycomb group protein Psc-like [Coccinella septempunctata]XP_044762699.1 polycomb group protein Psc-like [Coccinella septempunctata]
MEALHPKRELPQPEQKSPAIADERKQSTPTPEGQQQQQQPASTPEETATQLHQKVKLRDVNSSLTCELCKGYLIDATTISECLHSFCRSCIIKFLQENSFCPVCEVIINKAKPNLKLDKTLQDIVYKLVPGLFLSEMMRRRHFYADKPVEAGRASPEQRGEDTERTIFNPQDRISLSLEYIGDAATTDLILKDLKQKQDDASKDALLKRYLQCPAMCRIDVIKKFIRNKYNVNTDMFQIDILYKRVPLPLPDHYTLIDVAYIYTWKRNEPMRFYFRIIDKGNDELPDLTKVFPPVEDDAPFLPKPLALSTPNKTSKRPATPPAREKSKKTPKRCVVSKKPPLARPAKKQKTEDEEKSSKKNEFDNDDDDDDRGGKSASVSESTTPKKTPAKTDVENGETPEPDSTLVKKENDAGVASEHCDNKVYTNITLNRSNNFEIVTKIQKLSDKDGQQIEVNIIDKSAWQKVECNVSRSNVAKEEVSVETKTPERVKEEEPSPSKPSPNVDHEPEVTSTTNDPSPQVAAEEEELEKTKFEFLKSIELTAKKVVDNLAKLVQQQQQNNALASRGQQNLQTPPKPEAKKQPKQETNGLKRKNSSPVKIESKRTKVEPKRTTKIILQQKPGYPPLNLTKPSEQAAAGPEELIKQNRNELRSLFQNCRLNIPSSLSITLKENGETSRQPVQMPPVQNFIEILKIDEASGTQTVTLKRDDAKKPEPNKQTVPSVPEQAKRKRKESTDKQKEQQSFQKIFEESIKKNGPEPEAPQCSSGKSKILEIAQQLYKKNKTTEHEAKKPPPPPATSNPFVMTQKLQKIAIPRLNNQRVVKPPKRSQKYDNATHQTLANLHSSSLGLNYTVSVGKQTRDVMKSNGVVSQSKTVDSQSFGGCADQAKPNAAFPTQPGLVSPKTDSKAAFSPKPSLGSTNSPSGSPRVFSPQMSPKLGAKTPSPKPKPHLSPKPKPNLSPKPKPNVSPNPSVAGGSSTVPPLTANELLEKYNIQNLAQLSASMNFNAQAYLSSMSQKQMSTLHQSMLMKQLEMHSRQNWFNINQAPLLQYEKYLQTLGASKNQQIMGNLKDN